MMRTLGLFANLITLSYKVRGSLAHHLGTTNKLAVGDKPICLERNGKMVPFQSIVALFLWVFNIPRAPPLCVWFRFITSHPLRFIEKRVNNSMTFGVTLSLY